MATIETGKKLTKEEAAKMDPGECGHSVLPKAEAEVEGQGIYYKPVICPWCGSVVTVLANTAYFKWFICCVCGGSFMA